MTKQAILIMAHNEFYVLETLLKLIDYELIDIYLHIDKRAKNIDFNKLRSCVHKSNLYFIKRMKVPWGRYEMIKCELELLKSAQNNYHYSYYHLISGVDLPIKNIEYIYNYFNTNQEFEYVAFKNPDLPYKWIDRIKYYYFFFESRKLRRNQYFMRFISFINNSLLKLQKLIGINRIKNSNIEFKKGANWFSISNKCVEYVLDNFKLYEKYFKYTNNADEIFLQTIIYNSEFKSRIRLDNEFNDEHRNTKRFIDWDRGDPYVFELSDFEDLINSQMFFARKFSAIKDKEIIDKLFNYFMKEG